MQTTDRTFALYYILLQASCMSGRNNCPHFSQLLYLVLNQQSSLKVLQDITLDQTEKMSKNLLFSFLVFLFPVKREIRNINYWCKIREQMFNST